jgi:hypothetical protein
VTGQLRAELLKQRSTQTTLFLFLAMASLVALASALHVLAPSPSGLASLSLPRPTIRARAGPIQLVRHPRRVHQEPSVRRVWVTPHRPARASPRAIVSRASPGLESLGARQCA